MLNKKDWNEFKDSGLFWFVNTILHTFGWAIVMELDENENILSVYPARVKFRGFKEESNTNGYIKVSEYLKNNIDDILKESKE